MIHLITALLLFTAAYPQVCSQLVTPNRSQTQLSVARCSVTIGIDTLKIAVVAEQGSKMTIEVCVANASKPKYRKTHELRAFNWSDEEETVEYRGTLVTVLKWSSKGNPSSTIYLSRSIPDDVDIIQVELPKSIYRHIQAFDGNTGLILEREK